MSLQNVQYSVCTDRGQVERGDDLCFLTAIQPVTSTEQSFADARSAVPAVEGGRRPYFGRLRCPTYQRYQGSKTSIDEQHKRQVRSKSRQASLE